MKIIKKVADLLEKKGLNETTVSASDENSIDETLEIVKGYDADTLDVITQINTHSYSGSQLQALNTFAKENGKTLRSEEHTSELQSRGHLVCRLLLEKKKAQ